MPGSSGADSAGSFVTPTVTKVKQRAATTAGKAGGGSIAGRWVPQLHRAQLATFSLGTQREQILKIPVSSPT
jgi:hypothetical protein